MKTMKFGGSSVRDAERIRNVVNIIKEEVEKEKIAVVLSAMKGNTDNLIDCAKLAEEGNVNYKTILEEICTKEKKTFIELIGKDKEKEAYESLEAMLNNLREILLGVMHG